MNPAEDKEDKTDQNKVENQKNLRNVGIEPSGYDGQNPGTAGPGNTAVNSPTPETKAGQINPSAPNDVNVTHGKR